MTDLAALEIELLAAAQAGDKTQQMRLYHRAAQCFLDAGQVDEGCFYLTNAWVLSLELGDPIADELQRVLLRHGRIHRAP